MFRAVAKAPLLAEAGIQALCPSLNSPVLNIDELPVGPARAVIAVYAEEYGDLRAAVALRSLNGREGAFFVYRGAGQELTSVKAALDAALSFAEGLGFLIDDDWVVQQGSAGAMALWLEISAGPEAYSLADPASIDPLDEPAELELDELAQARKDKPREADDLLLDEVAALELDEPALDPEPVLDLGAPVPTETPSETDAGPVRAASTLTKFRSTEQPTARTSRQSAARDAANGASQLGRIALVRKRLGNAPEPPEKRSLLLRLLGQF